MAPLAAVGLALAITAAFMACWLGIYHLEPEDLGRVTSRGRR